MNKDQIKYEAIYKYPSIISFEERNIASQPWSKVTPSGMSVGSSNTVAKLSFGCPINSTWCFDGI